MKGRSRKKKTVRQRETKTQETKTQNLERSWKRERAAFRLAGTEK